MEGSGWVRLFQNIIQGCSYCNLTVHMVITQGARVLLREAWQDDQRVLLAFDQSEAVPFVTLLQRLNVSCLLPLLSVR